MAFDDQTSTEANYDFVQFLTCDTRSVVPNTQDKYSGGRNGSGKNFPTMEHPLELPVDEFIIHFQSDGSNNVR